MTNAKEFLKIIRERRSIRSFRPEPIAKEILLQLVEAAGWAPSASNRQDWLFTIITSPETKEKMAGAVDSRWKEIVDRNRDMGFIEEVQKYAAGFSGFAQAPAVIMVSALKANESQKHLLGDMADSVSGSAASAAMAAQNLMLAANAMGLGSCCMTGALAARDELAELAGLGKKRRIVCLVALGYANEDPEPPERKTAEEITRFIE